MGPTRLVSPGTNLESDASGNWCLPLDNIIRIGQVQTIKNKKRKRKTTRQGPLSSIWKLVGNYSPSDQWRRSIDTAGCPRLQKLKESACCWLLGKSRCFARKCRSTRTLNQQPAPCSFHRTLTPLRLLCSQLELPATATCPWTPDKSSSLVSSTSCVPARRFELQKLVMFTRRACGNDVGYQVPAFNLKFDI